MKKIKTKCDFCNKNIYKTKQAYKNHKYHFCNIQCLGKWRSEYQKGKKNPRWSGGELKVKCCWCEKIFYRKKYAVKKYKNHFCNVKCQGRFFSEYFSGERSPLFGVKYKRKRNEKLYKIIKCSWCNKKIKRLKKYIKNKKNNFCSNKCQGKWMSKYRRGKNNPCTIKKIKVQCTTCNKTLYRRKKYVKKLKHQFCNRKCFAKWFAKQTSILRSGKNHPNYIDGMARYPYTMDFNEKLKESIRKRDKYKCQNKDCGIPQKECFRALDVHHIDYNKKNCDPINLISLCQICNIKANYNRKYWQNNYENIQIERKVHLLDMKLEMELY